MKTENALENINSTLYLHKNKHNGRIYLGVHRTDESDDGYISSSTCPHFRYDWNNGALKRVELFFGPYKESINLEYQLLSKYDAINNTRFYNKSNGGGALVDKHYVVDSQVFDTACEWIDGKRDFEETTAVVIGSYNQEKMIQLKADYRNGLYPTVDLAIDMLYPLERIQPREELLDLDHVENLASFYKYPEIARPNMTPIIVSKIGDKLIKIVDGNHRLEAAYKSNWVTIPAVVIDDEIFENVEKNYRDFGLFMNNHQIQVKSNSPSDLEKLIREEANEHQHLAIDSVEFMDMIKLRYGGLGTGKTNGCWENSLITKKCKKIAEKNLSRELLETKNFIQYSKSKLDKFKGIYKFQYPKIPTITQSIESICNAGFGGITSMMTEEGASEGTIIVHYGNRYENWENRSHLIEKFDKQTKNILAPGLKINLIFLNAFEREGFEGH